MSTVINHVGMFVGGGKEVGNLGWSVRWWYGGWG